MVKKRKNQTKEAEAVATQDDDPFEPKKPQQPAGVGATAAANELASTQLDSDDDDYSKRKSLKTYAHNGKYDPALRRERKRLYELQESKRRGRQEEGRSKSKTDGETPLLQKVKRLKTERKEILKEYASTGGSMKKGNNKKKKKRSAGIPLPKA